MSQIGRWTYGVIDTRPLLLEHPNVLAYHGSADPYAPISTEGSDYGALKVLCEQEAERQFPARTFIARPGYITGPDDTHAPLLYWCLRMQHGGEVLAAGDPSTPVQLIDVRDLAGWVPPRISSRSGFELGDGFSAAPAYAPSASTLPAAATWLRNVRLNIGSSLTWPRGTLPLTQRRKLSLKVGPGTTRRRRAARFSRPRITCRCPEVRSPQQPTNGCRWPLASIGIYCQTG